MEQNELKAMMSLRLDDNLKVDFNSAHIDESIKVSSKEQAFHSKNMAKLENMNTSHAMLGGTNYYKDNTAFGVWRDWYYPEVIRETYPIYLQQRSEDKGQRAFEIIKHLQDKKLMKLDTVKEFIEAMDTLLKIL